MKFLIQKINGKIVHDFSFTLLQTIEFKNWLTRGEKCEKVLVKYFDTVPDATEFKFKQIHNKYVPVGTVEFVSAFLRQFFGLTPKPLNVPEELFNNLYWKYTQRYIFNGTEKDIVNLTGRWFVKSNDKIKGFSGIITLNGTSQIPESIQLFAGNYQFSKYINIESEWRAFVYDGKLVGLQNYAGEFTKFPNVCLIKEMIEAYKSAPVAYTLDVGVNDNGTFVIECHSFFSCGLYCFNDIKYPNMLYKWFYNYINNIK
jgi:hypothetical protein